MWQHDEKGDAVRSAVADRLLRRGSRVAARLADRIDPRAPREPDESIIYLVSLAGHPNYGDELVLRTWLRYLARVRPGATVIADVAHVGEAALIFQDDHPRVLFVDTLWRLARFADDRPEDIGDYTPQDWVAYAATDMRVAPLLAEGVERLHRAESVHLVGGGYINGMWPQWLPVVSAVAAVVRESGARAYATGLGLLPLPSGDSMARLLSDAGAFEIFDVRDRASFTAIDGVPGASFSGDDVWLGLDGIAVPTMDTSNRGVVLCIQRDLSEGFAFGDLRGTDALTDYVRRILDAWDVPGSEVTVVEGIPGYDFTVPMALGERIDGSRIIPFLDVWRHGLPVGTGATWISTRFHPHLVAAAAGDSGVAIVPKPDYYGAKHRSLADAGSRWTIVESPSDIPERPTAGGFSTLDRNAAIARKSALAQHLYPPR